MGLLSLKTAGQAVASRLATAALTPRETEVLSWVAKGKTHRNVGGILGAQAPGGMHPKSGASKPAPRPLRWPRGRWADGLPAPGRYL